MNLLPQLGQAKPGLLGQGMAGQAAHLIQSRPYQMYVQEAKAMGQLPLPYEQWVQTNQPRGLLGR